ncbi:YolD-like family protein [Paenibacillus polymyxa]|uniref:YolD-like family protein n=1 Tax=Paenibacillus polymyxa TaxID=1406 RepID=UPI0004DF1162|nr:YolD-like family protein [Paenibacillus polymyxa]RPE03317.1 YolD-like family protein [Paenibacillus polymyxa]
MLKKLEGNRLWESSRIIIPEHKEAYLKLMKDRQRRGKPELDDQEVLLIEQALIESYNTRQPVKLVVFSQELKGVISSINDRREVKLFRDEDDYSWIKLEDIISASI